MDKQQRIGEIDGQLSYLRANPDAENAERIRMELSFERIGLTGQAQPDPLPAFIKACASGAVEKTAQICGRDLAIEKIQADIAAMIVLDIFEVERIVESLLKVAGGDSTVNVQICLENVKADALAIEALMDEAEEAELPVRMQAF